MFVGVAMFGGAMNWQLPQDSSFVYLGFILWMIAGPLVVARDYSLYLDSKDD